MEEIWGYVKEAFDLGLRYWPFITWFITTMVVGQFMKHTVWTKQRAKTPGKWNWFWWWGYKSMVLHGAVAGVCLVAPLWAEPTAGVDTLVERMGYFGLAGLLGVAGYRVIKELAQKRGINISLPNLDDEETVPGKKAQVVVQEPAEEDQNTEL